MMLTGFRKSIQTVRKEAFAFCDCLNQTPENKWTKQKLKVVVAAAVTK